MQTTSYTRPILLRSSAFVHARSPRRQLTYPSALPAFSAVAQRSLQRRANNRGNFSLYAAVGDQHVTANLPEVGQAETERRLAKAIGLIQTADDLAPYDRIGFSAPLTIW